MVAGGAPVGLCLVGPGWTDLDLVELGRELATELERR
jgi:Asp-tRNA(Asn)/Glu-tRNA(Gln) amidotransferase A subunit family amidase